MKKSKNIAGVDEVGAGPLAGPVVAAAVVMPPEVMIPYVNDSKKLSLKRRESLVEEIKDKEQEFITRGGKFITHVPSVKFV